MASQKIKAVCHTNDLGSYIGNWRITLYQLNRILKIQPPTKIPQQFVSFGENRHDLSLMLSYLDTNLTILERTKCIARQQIDSEAYGEARSFLKVCYLLVRILFDDIAGVIKYFYDKNEPNSGVTKSFGDLIKKAQIGKLPNELSTLVDKTVTCFPEMRNRRVDLEHFYESLLISFKWDKDGKTILGHFGTKGQTTTEYEDIRQYFGLVLCEFQKLIDNLLDHFDNKFMEWYKFKPQRNFNIYQGYSGIMLYWAYKYGGYTHKHLKIIENSEVEVDNE